MLFGMASRAPVTATYLPLHLTLLFLPLILLGTSVSCMHHFHLCALLLLSFFFFFPSFPLPGLNVTDSSLQKLSLPGGLLDPGLWFSGSLLGVLLFS